MARSTFPSQNVKKLTVSEHFWQKALQEWLQAFEMCGFPGVLGDALSGQMYAADDAAAGLILRDALGVKSPHTSMKRAQTLT